MIITPAILFIVCISDIMHFTNKQNKVIKNKYDFFIKRIDKVGKAIILTSFTTAISFLTFIFNDIPPISRFGISASPNIGPGTSRPLRYSSAIPASPYLKAFFCYLRYC